MSRHKKILIIVDSIDIDDSSGSKANIGLIKNLHALGYNLKVYHYTRKEIQLTSINCISIREKKWNIIYLLSRSQRVFTRITGININPFIEGLLGFSFTFFNDVSSIKKALLKEKEFKPDLVLTSSKGASFRPHYALLKLSKWHSKWLAYVHDPYPFHYYPKPYDWFEPGFRKKEAFFREVSEKAKYSAFPSKLLLEWMGKYYPIFLKTGLVIPHQHLEVDISDISVFPNYFIPEYFNILHAGNLMKQRSPKGLIEGFKLFLKQNTKANTNARLLLLGNASYHKEMLENYNKDIAELYISYENVPFMEVNYIQQHTSINIILESKSEISPFLPGKFPHCVFANKLILVLGPQYSETRRLLGENYIYKTEADNIEEIASLIGQLYFKWVNNRNNLQLKRKDLEDYVSVNYLEQILLKIMGTK